MTFFGATSDNFRPACDLLTVQHSDQTFGTPVALPSVMQTTKTGRHNAYLVSWTDAEDPLAREVLAGLPLRGRGPFAEARQQHGERWTVVLGIGPCSTLLARLRALRAPSRVSAAIFAQGSGAVAFASLCAACGGRYLGREVSAAPAFRFFGPFLCASAIARRGYDVTRDDRSWIATRRAVLEIVDAEHAAA